MSTDNQFSNAALEQAVSEIRYEAGAVPEAVVEAAAARVWAKLQAAAEGAPDHAIEHQPVIRNCEDFQALIPDYRAHILTGARAMLLEDHLHQCVACRRMFEGKVTVMPAAQAAPTVQTVSEAAIQARIDQAADRAVAARTQQLKDEIAAERQRLLMVAAQLEVDNRRQHALYMSAAEYGPPRQPALEAK